MMASFFASAQPVEALTGGKRCMFVYVGTGSVSLDLLRDVLPQVFPANGERVCLVGAQSIVQPEQIAGVKFLPYVPAESVLPGADWTLCHGGQNTIIQSLRRGVPLLVFPGPIFERRFNAQKVAEAGAGRMGELNQFSAAWLVEALAQQAQYAAGAARLQAQIHSYGGAEQAVAALEKFSGR
ncbi:MAG: hypothetical protein EOM58_10410 [Clostridia bacterium]|nr:hypothetical protein [Clostridia bacterium]